MKKFLTILFMVVLTLIVLAMKRGGFGSKLHLGTPEILGGVVRTDDESGGRLYYMTSQWEKRVSRSSSRSSSSSRTVSWLNIDLWELDIATAQPLSRRRLKREKVNADAKAMGMEQGVLWARIPELVGIRLADGEIVADKAKIEARNPSLAGLIPKPPESAFFLTDSMQPLKYSPEAGMIVRLDDARLVRIDPLTLEATPYVETAKSEKPSKPEGPEKAATFGVAVRQISYGMDWYTMVRGLTIEKPGGGMEWFGLLADPELEQVKEGRTLSHQMDFSVPRRQKLYRAQMEQVEEFPFGPRWVYKNPTALPESPDFLMSGLLTQGPGGSSDQTAMWRREPDSVFVLSRDRLGEDGHMQLARISGPKGTPVWSLSLPLSQMSAWVPGERWAVMLGPDSAAERSPMAEEGENAVSQIVTIDLKTGEMKRFNPDLHRDWPATGAPGEKK